MTSLPPLSLYIHFPWCLKKCPYCDFNSYEIKTFFSETNYLNALRKDLKLALPLILGRKITSIFIGGGTPSLISTKGLNRFLLDIQALLPLIVDIEITIEANPATFDIDTLKAYRDNGINRLSIGIQSFNNSHLAILGRTYNSNQARKAIEIAYTNFDNFNLDLMYALPTQNIEEAYYDLQTAISYKPSHLSLYHLTLEPNTVFAKFPPASIPDENSIADIENMIATETTNAHYKKYEISAYAKNKKQANHNLNYWQFGDYLGIGAGAHSKLSLKSKIIRQVRYKNPKKYLQKIHDNNVIQEEKKINPETLCFEFMLNALRLEEGFSINLFLERTGIHIRNIENILVNAENKGLLYRDQQTICPTKLGKRFLNNLQEMFLPK